MQLNFHPAPGMGEMVPGFFSVPSNPIAPVTYTPHIGELLAARFTVPENPLMRALTTSSSLNDSPAARAAGCGCIGSKCGCGGMGMGDLSLGAGIWPLLVGGGLLLWWLAFPSGKGYRGERERASSEYASRVRSIRGRHTGYSRVRRRLSAAGRAVTAG